MTKRLVLVLGALLVLAGSLAVACSSDTDDLEERIDAIEAQLAGNGNGDGSMEMQNAAMVAALGQLDTVGFHELNETIDADGVAPAGASGSISRAATAVAATAWPADLQAEADQFVADLMAFLAMLQEDIQGEELAASSLTAHDDYHSFSDSAWTYLGEQFGIQQGANEMEGMDHEDMDMDHEEDMDSGTSSADDMDHMDGEPTP